MQGEVQKASVFFVFLSRDIVRAQEIPATGLECRLQLQRLGFRGNYVYSNSHFVINHTYLRCRKIYWQFIWMSIR